MVKLNSVISPLTFFLFGKQKHFFLRRILFFSQKNIIDIFVLYYSQENKSVANMIPIMVYYTPS